jgi:hypothetical protein
MATVTLYLRGDQIGTYATLSGEGNGADRIVTLTSVQRVGSPSDIYTVTVTQVGDGVTEFQNGQFITITDPQGMVIVSSATVTPDAEQGMASGDEHLILGWPTYVLDLGGLPASPSDLTYGQADQAADINEGDNDGELDFADFPCFAAGSMILTPAGETEVTRLKPGDLVMTRDHGPQPLRWIGMRELTFPVVPHPRQPILFQSVALSGPGIGRRLAVSPQHRMLLAGPEVRRMFGVAEVLAPAKGLTVLKGVRPMKGRLSATYVSLLFDRHEVLTANGYGSESFYPGRMGLRMLGATLRAEVLALFPCLSEGPEAWGPPARRLIPVRAAMDLARAMNSAGKAPARPFVAPPDRLDTRQAV